MKKYLYDLGISAETEDEADRKSGLLAELGRKFSVKGLEAFLKLDGKLTEKELVALGNIAENDPLNLAAAKLYLNK